LSIDVLGVDRLSKELRGKLLVEEFAVWLVAFIKTLCGLCLNFCKVEDVREGGFVGVLVGLVGPGFSILRVWFIDFRGLEEETVLAVTFPVPSPVCSVDPFPVFRLGDGDLDEAIHDFRAKVAKDSDTVFDLSREALGSEGTGGMALGGMLSSSGASILSGDPFTRCIQDLGRATKDFRLPTCANFGRSSFEGNLVVCSSVVGTLLPLLLGYVGEGSTEATRYSCSLLYCGPANSGREVKLAGRGMSPSSGVEGREGLYLPLMIFCMLEEDLERSNKELESKTEGIVKRGAFMANRAAHPKI
jgi:hypothetical protein